MTSDAPHNTHWCWATDQRVFFFVTGNTLSAPCGLIQGSVASFGSVPKPNAIAHKKGKVDRQSIEKKIILNYDPYMRSLCVCVCVCVCVCMCVLCVCACVRFGGGRRGYSVRRANDFLLITKWYGTVDIFSYRGKVVK